METIPGAVPATTALAGALVLLLFALSALVTAQRARLGGIEFGDADDVELRHRIRAHGNFIEIAPLVVVAIGLMEWLGAPASLVWLLALTFFVGRLLHAARMYFRNRWLGLPAIVTQHLICLVTGIWLIRHVMF